MYQLVSLLDTLTFRLRHLENGMLKEKSKQNLLKEVIEDISLTLPTIRNWIDKKSVMQESLLENKLKTSIHKLNSCLLNFLNTQSSPILVLLPILKERVFKPFWNKSVMNKSKKLWLPTETGSTDSLLNISNTSVASSIQKLLFSTIQKKKTPKNLKNLQMTSLLSLLPSQQDTTVPGNISYTRKIRIYPNQKQLKLFSECFGASRYFYNKGVEYLNNEYKTQLKKFDNQAKKGCLKCNKSIDQSSKFFCKKHLSNKLKFKTTTSHISLRNEILTNDKDLTDEEQWQKKIPYDTRQLAIKSLCGNLKSAISNKKNGNIKSFSLSFKSRKDKRQVFFCDSNALNGLYIFKRRLKGKQGKLRVRKKYLNYKNYKPKSDFIIQKEGNRYYILLSKTRKTVGAKAKLKVVSLDPGVRTFQTFYSPEGCVGKLGHGLANHINKFQKKEDLFKSLKCVAETYRTRRNIKNRITSLITKVKNVVTDFHWKTVSYLCKNFEKIVIPEFGVKNLVNKASRNIGKGTTRALLSLRHGSFLEKLKYKCKELGRLLYIVEESYTSKTCGSCGNIDTKLGSAKIYNCKKCNVKIDRDYNGARNILLKTLHGLDTTR